MPRLIAIDCDAREICFVVATSSGDRVTLEAAVSLPVKPTAEDRALTDDELGKQAQAALSKFKRAGTKYLTAVDRSRIELSEITVPPSSDAELPELVANQIAMQSPAVADESVVDFIPAPGSPTESRRVTAASLAKSELSRVNAICLAAGFTPDRVVVRPYETALLFLNQRPPGSGHSLLVNVIGEEVDLIVVDQTRPLFFRSVRLPAGLGDDAAEQRLLDEIRRTILVAPQNAEVGHIIDSVQVLGVGTEYVRVAQQIAKDSSTKVEVHDPLTSFTLGSGFEKLTSGRIIPLLGMLLGEARGGQHSIDFLHPRRAPVPPNRRRQLIIGGALAAVSAGAGLFYLSERFTAADREIKALREELAELDNRVKKTTEKRKITDALEEWNSNTVVWLDELRDLSSKFPPGQDIVIQRLSLSPARGGKASISFLGLARESNVVPRMEAAIQDSRHEIQTPRVEKRDQDKAYAWSFETSISLVPAKIDLDDLLEIPAEAPVESEPEIKKTKRKSGESTPQKSSKTRTKSGKPVTREKSAAKDAALDDHESDESEKTSTTEATREP